eukprot:UN16418
MSFSFRPLSKIEHQNFLNDVSSKFLNRHFILKNLTNSIFILLFQF